MGEKLGGLTNKLTAAMTLCGGLLCATVFSKPAFGAGYCESYKGEALNLNEVTVERLVKVKPAYDGFNIFEGPVWLDGALYFSNLGTRQEKGIQYTNRAEIRRWQPGSNGDTWLSDDQAGTNGLAVDSRGNIIAGRQMTGSLVAISPSTKEIKTLASEYEDKRFNSPNDLVISQQGVIYFTDPSWNIPSNTDRAQVQGGGEPGETSPGQRVYRVRQDGTVTALSITEQVKALRDKPNGITLSLDEKHLFVAGLQGLWVFDFKGGDVSNARQLQTEQVDGLGRDCAGNIYVTTKRRSNEGKDMQVIAVYDAQFKEVGLIRIRGAQLVTNVAFGGPQRKTLFITSLGNDKDSDERNLCDGQPCHAASLYKVELNVPGLPY